MLIKYPSEHKWLENVNSDPLSGFGKNNRTRLKSTLKNIADSNVSYTIEPLSEDILRWFTTIYKNSIGSKNNPKVHDIYSTTLGKESIYPYFALILQEQGNPIGATIFSKRKSIISIAYRIYPNQWEHNSFQASPSIYTEYIINKYSHEEGYRTISHGKDRNPYGINSSIGLALFKLSIGCHVYLPTTPYEIKELESNLVTEDILVFAMSDDESTKIKKGFLITTADNTSKYENVTKYPEQIEIEIITRN